jgi:hypothetical protein
MYKRFMRLQLQQLSQTTPYKPRPRRACIRNGLKLVVISLECRPDLCYIARTLPWRVVAIFTNSTQTLPRERSPKRHLRGRQSLTPLSATQLKVDDVQSETDHGRAPTLLDDEPHSTRRISRRPSATGDLLSIGGGPSEASSMVRGSEMRRHTISSSNCQISEGNSTHLSHQKH